MRRPVVKVAILVALALILVMSFSSVAFAGQWSDLPDSLTAKYGLTEDQVAAISDGYNGVWQPWRDTTRAQFVKMAVAAFQIPLTDPATASFTDVPKGSAYYQYIEGAKAAGVVEGATAATFSPEASITRQEAIVIIVRYAARNNDYDLATRYSAIEVDTLLVRFSDDVGISADLRTELAFAYDYGIVRGDENDNLNPLADLWRIQAAALLIRSEGVVSPPPITAGSYLASTIMDKLLDSLGGEVSSAGFGWLLSLIGLGDSASAETIRLLNQISAQIDKLSAQVEAMQKQLGNMAYDNLAASLLPTVSAIETAYELLMSLAESTESPTASLTAASTQNQIDDIRQIIAEKILPNKEVIGKAMLGTGFADGGLIVKWSRAVAGRHHFFNKSDSDAQQQMYEYWFGLQAIQQQLLVEYYNYRGYTTKTVETEINNCKTSIEAQKKLLPRPLPSSSNYPGDVYVVKSAVDQNLRPYGPDLMINAHVLATRSVSLGMTGIEWTNAMQSLSGLNGFSDWRVPHYDWRNRLSPELRTVFEGATAPVYNWMIREGWSEKEFPPRAAIVGFQLYTDGVLERGAQAAWSSEIFDKRINNGFGFLNPFAPGGLCLLPVRNLAADEFYFYH